MTKRDKYYFSLIVLLCMFMASDKPLIFAGLAFLLLVGNFIVDDKP